MQAPCSSRQAPCSTLQRPRCNINRHSSSLHRHGVLAPPQLCSLCGHAQVSSASPRRRSSNAAVTSYGAAAQAAVPALQQGRRRGMLAAAAGSAVSAAVVKDPAVPEPAALPAEAEAERVTTETWLWQHEGARYRIRYQAAGRAGPALVLVHGFGGNCDHWRKNIPVLARSGRVWAIDLLGYGYSDKPDPTGREPNAIYNFDTWSAQLRAFLSQVVGGPAFLICNSVGGIAGLQAAVDAPEQVLGLQLLDISLRMLHITKQPAWQRPAVAGLQRALRTTALGPLFFRQVATREGVRSILRKCYGDASAVTDELVDCILAPGLEPGAVAVFLDFISYSGGPLPEELLARVTRPVSILWGAADPWEKVEWGRKFAEYPSVEEFVELPGVGHCPQDEAPQLVNPAVLRFVERHAPGSHVAADALQ